MQGSFAAMVVKWSKGKPTPATPVVAVASNKRKGAPEDADHTNTQASPAASAMTQPDSTLWGCSTEPQPLICPSETA